MAERYRALAEAFLLELERRGGMPKTAAIKLWFKEHYGGIRTNTASALRQGTYVPERIVTGFVEMLVRGSANPKFAQGCVTLAAFVAQRGIQPLSLDRLEAILSHACTSPREALPDGPGGQQASPDLLRSGAARLAGFDVKQFLASARGCRSLVDISRATDWLFVTHGRALAAQGASASPKDAVRATEEHLRISRNTYRDRLAAWQAKNPWSVVIARRDAKDVGTSIVLPVADTAYDAVRSGQRVSFACSPDDLLKASRSLIVEAVGENHEAPNRQDATEAMTMALIVQLCALTRHGTWPGRPRYRWLSFGGTPVNRVRLASNGYVATGGTMALTGEDLWERVIDMEKCKTESSVPMADAAILDFLSPSCPDTPPVD